MKHVALLRAINVGGKNNVPMKALVEIFTSAGCTEVQTYIQSGNVVFSASGPVLTKLPTLVSAAILKQCGCQVPVVLRTASELRAALGKNPFMKEKPDENALQAGWSQA
jgi:uncharacterized protein (DUF1697 family)